MPLETISTNQIRYKIVLIQDGVMNELCSHRDFQSLKFIVEKIVIQGDEAWQVVDSFLQNKVLYEKKKEVNLQNGYASLY